MEEDRLADMLFDYETTSRHDYQKPFIELKSSTEGKPYYINRKSAKRSLQPELTYPNRNPKFVETMTKWKDCLAPFNLFMHPDPVHGYDPRVTQRPFDPPGDPDREKVQKTRPRLVMTPAASLDDIKDQEVRDIVIKDMYVSTLNRAQRPTAEVAFPVDNAVKAPLADTYSPPRPLDIPKLKPPYVSTEWRMDSVPWDCKQMRGQVSATAEFWARRPLRNRVEREN